MSIMPGEIYGLFVKHENVFCGDLSQWKDDDDFFESTDFVLDMEGIEIDTDDYKGVYITSAIPNSTFEDISSDEGDEPDGAFILPLEKSPTLDLIESKAAYDSVEDIVEELREKYGSYLPEDYDYKNNIVRATYAYWG